MTKQSCLTCRVTGSLTLGACGAYVLSQSLSMRKRSDKVGVGLFSAFLFAGAIYRAVVDDL